jgi:hypothetical protein
VNVPETLFCHMLSLMTAVEISEKFHRQRVREKDAGILVQLDIGSSG